MNIIETSDQKAKLADIRLRIVIDIDVRAPWRSSDLIFNPIGSSVTEAPLYDPDGKDDIVAEREIVDGNYTLKFYTTKERIEELCGDDPKFQTKEGIEELWQSEKHELEAFFNGECYGLVKEMWSNELRDWVQLDSIWGIIGKDELKDQIDDYIKSGDVMPIDAICAGHPEIENSVKDFIKNDKTVSIDVICADEEVLPLLNC